MKRFCIAFLLVGIGSSANAQIDNSFREAFESFRQQARKDYDDFRSKANAEYAEWVKKAWKEFKAEPAVAKPKDEEVPPVVIKDEDKKKPIDDKPVVIEEEIKIPAPEPQPEPIAPVSPKPAPVVKPIKAPVVEPRPTAQTLKFALYGTAMEVRAGEKLRFSLPNLKKESIAKAWKRLASDEYDNLVADCLGIRLQRQLCDWAYLRMLEALSGALLGSGTNEAELLKAFIYCQSGYQMRLAFEGDRLRMLFASKYHLFGKPCWRIDGVCYFADDIKADELSICEASFPNEQALSMAISEEMILASKPSEERTIASKDMEWMKATVTEDENLMAFFNEYPASYCGDDFMTRWAMYANTPTSRNVKEKLYPQLQAWIEGRENAEAVDVLCHWVQTAFKYEYDDKVWGGDRAFFADETLYYPYCDCEDRSILLTRLVRDLLGLKCALVYYPGHLATAIAIGEDVKGDYIRIGGTKFIVCDPTYIGAPIGKTMPEMDNKSAKVIVL